MENISLELQDIKLTYLDKEIVDIPRLAVHQFDRIGIVGKNGAGKSSLLKIMAEIHKPDQGVIKQFSSFAYFDQLSTPTEKEIAHDLKGKLSIPGTDKGNFSGGEQTRLKLAQVFTNYHEGLMLDEPTTHLDEAGKQFFIEELTYYYGALILVSHDRYILDQLVTKIWEMDDGKVTEYSGNYSDYVAAKEQKRIEQQEQHEKYEKEKARLDQAAEMKMKKADKITQASGQMSKKETKATSNRMYMTKSKGTSQKSAQRAAKAILSRVSQLEAVEAPKENQMLKFHNAKTLELHNKFPIMADGLTMYAGDKLLLKKARFQFPLGETIVIKGDNGSGKSTLLRHVYEKKTGITISPKAVIGVYKQMAYQFSKKESVIEYITERSDYEESKARAVLHAMDFTGNDLKKDVRDLSGGEAVRLSLCELFLGRYNVLILDEPTNFLDVFCMEALERIIQAYEGTILLVSHDTIFTERVGDRFYRITENDLKEM